MLAPHEYYGSTLWGAWPYDGHTMRLLETERDAIAYLERVGGGMYKQIGAKMYQNVAAPGHDRRGTY